MELKYYINNKESISNILAINKEIQNYVIDFEFNKDLWCFEILTTPMNEKIITSIFNKYCNQSVFSFIKR